jgi:hypothetical protein
MENKRHPFSYTLGPGPYKFVGFGTINFSETYGSKYVGPKMDTGCGTCSHCGHAIMNIYIVKTGEGKLCGVGSDCINKVANDGEFTNLSDFERRVRAEKKKTGQERREKQRIALKDKLTKLVFANSLKLAAISFERAYTKTAWDYCAWYVKEEHSLGGYKLFQKKLSAWGINEA